MIFAVPILFGVNWAVELSLPPVIVTGVVTVATVGLSLVRDAFTDIPPANGWIPRGLPPLSSWVAKTVKVEGPLVVVVLNDGVNPGPLIMTPEGVRLTLPVPLWNPAELAV